MADFIYIVRTEEGVRREGVIEAANLNEASDKLRQDNSTIVKVSERDTSFDFMGPFLDRLSISVEKIKNRIPLSILVFFTRQLATMFSAGLTLERAIQSLGAEEKHRKFKKVLNSVSENICCCII